LKNIYKISGWISVVALIISVVLFIMDRQPLLGVSLFIFLLFLATTLRQHPFLKGFSYSIIILGAVILAMFHPGPFQQIGTFKMSILIVPLLQLIMFGMGTAMSFKDFIGVIKMPKSVGIGILCQFTIMPFVGLGLATLFAFPPEIAAGVILIGSSPSGLASNVMSYLAKANVALSVTLTAIATLIAPIMTPLLMKWLAAQYVPIEFIPMMWSIIKIVIIPIIAGLIFNHFFHGKIKWLDDAMPLLSMSSIAIIITIITAAGRDSLLTIGFALIIAAIIHNGLGYLLGYYGAKLFGLPERDCRTVALEVGMQNGGLASGIAMEMGKVATVGLAPAVFGPWMNISGGSLATWWRERPTGDEIIEEEPDEHIIGT
jgi:BASS family bile acid:Na+ symporter